MTNMNAHEFENFAREVFSAKFGTRLTGLKLAGFPKKFDLVSADGQIVGDAKFFSMVRGSKAPPAKWSAIAEHVWFLEKTKARTRFLVFGNDHRVAATWIQRWGEFVPSDIDFYFLGNDKSLELLPKYRGLAS